MSESEKVAVTSFDLQQRIADALEHIAISTLGITAGPLGDGLAYKVAHSPHCPTCQLNNLISAKRKAVTPA